MSELRKPTLDESDILLDDSSSQITEETEDNEIQAVPIKRSRGRPTLPVPEPVYKPREKPLVKKERTEAQKEATRKMLEVRDRNRANRTSVKAVKEDLKVLRDQQISELKAQAIKEYQDSLVKKAISIKKKEIKKKIELEEAVSDDDTPIEEIRKIVKQPVKTVRSNPVPTVPIVPIKPSITFI
jgi:hypothetical protein